MKEQIEELEIEKKFEKHEQSKSREMFVDSVQNTSIKIDVLVTTIIITSKKLFDFAIFIDEKNSNIKD